mgnify:CR=1 FL=1
MATHPTRPRGVARKSKRPNSSPYDRGRVSALEQTVEQMQEGERNGS